MEHHRNRARVGKFRLEGRLIEYFGPTSGDSQRINAWSLPLADRVIMSHAHPASVRRTLWGGQTRL